MSTGTGINAATKQIWGGYLRAELILIYTKNPIS